MIQRVTIMLTLKITERYFYCPIAVKLTRECHLLSASWSCGLTKKKKKLKFVQIHITFDLIAQNLLCVCYHHENLNSRHYSPELKKVIQDLNTNIKN